MKIEAIDLCIFTVQFLSILYFILMKYLHCNSTYSMMRARHKFMENLKVFREGQEQKSSSPPKGEQYGPLIEKMPI